MLKNTASPAMRSVALLTSMTLSISAFANTPQASVAASPVNVILSTETREGLVSTSRLTTEAFQAQMDVVSNSARVSGNQALLLMSGQMSYPVRFKMIDRAKKSIIISTFSIYSDEQDGEIKDSTTKILVEKLISAKRDRNVDVRVIVDGGTSLLAESTLAIQKLRDAGIQVIKYNPIVTDTRDTSLVGAAPYGILRILQGRSPITNRWHEKTMVVDGEYLISGGLNWGEIYGKPNDLVSAAYSPQEFFSQPLVQELELTAVESWGEGSDTAWRDTDILVKGPVVRQAAARLLLDFSLLEILQDKRRAVEHFANATDEDYAKAEQTFNTMYLNDERFFPEQSSKNDEIVDPKTNMRYIYQRPKIDQSKVTIGADIKEYAAAEKVFVDPKNPNLFMTNFYINVINQAQKQILWGCHSNRPTKEVLAALHAAAQRGVDIIVVGNSPESAENLPDFGMLMYPKALCEYRKLMSDSNGKLRIFEWQKSVNKDGEVLTAGAFHSKVFSVDGVLTSVGSYNMSDASYRKHTEGTIAVTDSEFAKTAETMFQKDLAFTKELKVEDLNDRRCGVPLMKYVMGANHTRRDQTAAAAAQKRRQRGSKGNRIHGNN